MYHYIRNFDKDFPFFNFLHQKDFIKQNNFLLKKKDFIHLDESLDLNFSEKKFLLTFDDGLKEHLKIAQFLKKRKIMGLFFIPSLPLEKSDFLSIHKIHLIFGKYTSDEIISFFKKFNIKFNYNRNVFSIFKKQKLFLNNKTKITENDKKIYLKTLLNNLDQKNSKFVKDIFNYCFSKKTQKKIFKKFYLTKKDIIKIDKLGMKVGSHGSSHKVLSKLSYKHQLNDISKSLNFLGNILQKKINYFCFPYGGFKVFNKNTIKILKKKKIVFAFNVESKDWSKKSNNLCIPRFDCNEFKYGNIFKKR